jgi:hypothetical protein
MKRVVLSLLVICALHTYVVCQKYERPKVPTPTVFRGDPATQPDPHALADVKWFDLLKMRSCRADT